ncbi:hypothetical protein BX600DRAFT_555105 [Xylariales sp. PMI_506]|nr:hypothetical protein BX600DRAFT_555105 [Xylariales sp. PMI_506]
MSSESQNTQASEPVYVTAAKLTTDSPFYSPNIDKYLTPSTRQFLLQYSGIPLEDQSKHVHAIRDEAWAIRPYPCTGVGVWLVTYISRSPAYASVLENLKSGGTFLDVGCFIGADLRQLCYDGAPSDKMYGIDIVSHWELGLDMYRDRERFQGHFIQADIMKSQDSPDLVALKGSVDVISISAVMHQWVYEMQLECAKRLVELSKPGSIVLGYQIGAIKAYEFIFGPQKFPVWRHDRDSFSKMWAEAGEETGTTWEVAVRLLGFEEIGWDPKDQVPLGESARILEFVVTRTT